MLLVNLIYYIVFWSKIIVVLNRTVFEFFTSLLIFVIKICNDFLIPPNFFTFCIRNTFISSMLTVKKCSIKYLFYVTEFLQLFERRTSYCSTSISFILTYVFGIIAPFGTLLSRYPFLKIEISECFTPLCVFSVS